MRLAILLALIAISIGAFMFTLWLGGMIISAVQQAETQLYVALKPVEVNPTIKLETVVSLGPGDIIAPHLYDWKFDGENNYIIFKGYPYPQDDAFSAVTIAVRFKDTEWTTWRKLVGFLYEGNSYGCVQVGEGGSNDYYAQVSNGSIGIQSIGYGCNLGRPLWWDWSPDGYYTLAWAYDAINGKLFGYRDDGLVVTGIVTGPAYGDLLGGFTWAYVARNFWKGYISFIVLSDVMNATDVLGTLYGNTILDTAIVLLDATFYNGTHYFDLIANVPGTPYGGVERVLSQKRWLWVVKGKAEDGLIHFKWFPPGSVIEIYTADGKKLVARFTVTGVGTDVAVALPEGDYKIVAYCTIPYIVTVGPQGIKVEVAPETTTTRYLEMVVSKDSLATSITWQPTGVMTANLTLRNVHIEPGDVIAPHLYTWRFDGIDDYVFFDVEDYEIPLPAVIELEAKDKMIKTGFSPKSFGDTSAGWWHQFFFTMTAPAVLSFTEEHSNTNLDWRFTIFRVSNDTDWTNVLYIHISSGDGYDNRMWVVHHGYVDLQTTSQTIEYTLTLENGKSISKTASCSWTWSSIPVYSFRIGEKVALSGYRKPELLVQYVWVKANDKYIFIADPTFYDGTNYYDLSNNYTGVPYGDVVRLPSPEEWLWHFQGLASDSYVHFKWFPEGSVIKIYNATSGELIMEWRVASGETDIKLNLLSGNYTIVVECPVTIYEAVTTETLQYIAPGDVIVYRDGWVYVQHGAINETLGVEFIGFPEGTIISVYSGTMMVANFTYHNPNTTVQLPLIFYPTIKLKVPVNYPLPLTVKVEPGAAAAVEADSELYLLQGGEQKSFICLHAKVAPANPYRMYPTVSVYFQSMAPWISLLAAAVLLAAFAYSRRR